MRCLITAGATPLGARVRDALHAAGAVAEPIGLDALARGAVDARGATLIHLACALMPEERDERRLFEALLISTLRALDATRDALARIVIVTTPDERTVRGALELAIEDHARVHGDESGVAVACVRVDGRSLDELTPAIVAAARATD